MTDQTVSTPDEELSAMRRIVAALKDLDRGTQDRIAEWVYDRYSVKDAEA